MNARFNIIPATFTALLLALSVCAKSSPEPETPSGGPGADAKLDHFFRQYLEEHFRQQPLEATRLGDHRFDARLADVSRSAREEWRALARRTLRELPRQVEYAKLSRSGQLDFAIFKHDLETASWLADNTRPFEEDPRTYGSYINDSVYLLL